MQKPNMDQQLIAELRSELAVAHAKIFHLQQELEYATTTVKYLVSRLSSSYGSEEARIGGEVKELREMVLELGKQQELWHHECAEKHVDKQSTSSTGAKGTRMGEDACLKEFNLLDIDDTDKVDLLDMPTKVRDSGSALKRDRYANVPEPVVNQTMVFRNSDGELAWVYNGLPIDSRVKPRQSKRGYGKRRNTTTAEASMPFRSHQSLLNSACFTEDIPEAELDDHWEAYAKARGMFPAHQWRQYYEEHVRPLYLAKVGTQKKPAKPAVMPTVMPTVEKKGAAPQRQLSASSVEVWFEGKNIQLEYDDKPSIDVEETDQHPIEPSLSPGALSDSIDTKVQEVEEVEPLTVGKDTMMDNQVDIFQSLSISTVSNDEVQEESADALPESRIDIQPDHQDTESGLSSADDDLNLQSNASELKPLPIATKDKEQAIQNNSEPISPTAQVQDSPFFAEDDRFREARAFMQGSSKAKDRARVKYAASKAARPLTAAVVASEDNVVLKPTAPDEDWFTAVLVGGVPKFIEQADLIKCLKPNGMIMVRFANTAGMKTKPPMVDNTVIFVFNHPRYADWFCDEFNTNTKKLTVFCNGSPLHMTASQFDEECKLYSLRLKGLGRICQCGLLVDNNGGQKWTARTLLDLVIEISEVPINAIIHRDRDDGKIEFLFAGVLESWWARDIIMDFAELESNWWVPWTDEI